jgi:tRNA (mo5U34)-methyltransferase
VTEDLRAKVGANPLWYHTMELAPGVETEGWFDLRPIVDRLPWPDVAGKRCLDIGTYDGFLAFELERRGAAEVVCTDIPSHEAWDHLPRERASALAYLAATAAEKGAGFRIAAEILGSRVHREWINVYDLSPERLGTFDVVVCGSLLLHLRAPFVALERVAAVCAGDFLSAEAIDLGLTVRTRRPALGLDGTDGRWTVPNAAGHARMLDMAGFDVIRTTRPYVVPFGPAHPRPPRRTVRGTVQALASRFVTGSPEGVPHSAVLCRPAAR